MSVITEADSLTAMNSSNGVMTCLAHTKQWVRLDACKLPDPTVGACKAVHSNKPFKFGCCQAIGLLHNLQAQVVPGLWPNVAGLACICTATFACHSSSTALCEHRREGVLQVAIKALQLPYADVRRVQVGSN